MAPTPERLWIEWPDDLRPVKSVRDSIATAREVFAPRLRRQRLRCVELALRRRAALPAMRKRKQHRPQIAEEDKMDADPGRNIGENGRALHELTRMREFLAQR